MTAHNKKTMDEKTIKNAVVAAEKEIEEKNIERIKEIAKSYLEKINSKTKERNAIETEIKNLKKDLDDLKAGRLDKIEERQNVDPVAKKQSLIVVTKIVEKYFPAKPWYSQYTVNWSTPGWSTDGLTSVTTSSGNGTVYISATPSGNNAFSNMWNTFNSTSSNFPSLESNFSFGASGVNFQNFMGGTYKLDSGEIINL